MENRFDNEAQPPRIEAPGLIRPKTGDLAGFKDANQLRTAVARSEGDRNRRLRAKGLLPSEAEGLADCEGPHFSCIEVVPTLYSPNAEKRWQEAN